MGNLTKFIVDYWQLLIIGGGLLGISIDFFLRFAMQAWGLSKELKNSIAELKSIRKRAAGKVLDLDEIASKVMTKQYLLQLWKEYIKTLHPQKRDDESGQSRIVEWRATATAGSYFTQQAIVDSRLHSEYFKHVPGILTGLGIIGTFLGLISGLNQFDVSLDPAKAQEQLRNLVNSVGHAFLVSATAIILAIAITFIEKLTVTRRYRQVEELCELIDSFFTTGAGEEYLARLVTAAETSATQAAHLKDALVGDLKQILTELTTQQITAQSVRSGQISLDVGKAIADSLGEPIRTISEAVRGVSANQGDAVNRMLTDVLTSFSAQMGEMFGGQLKGMSDLLQDTSKAMTDTALQFSQLAKNMDKAGTGAVDAMGERLNRSLEAMEARQKAMDHQTGVFVEQIRSLVAESQSESSKKLQTVLGAVGEQVAGVVAELRKQAEESAESQGRRHERFEKSTGDVMGALSAHIERLLDQSIKTNRALQETVERLAAATDKSITGMNSGAETLYLAATDFAKAGQGVSDSMRASTVAVETIKVAAGQLVLATNSSKAVLEDYGKTRDTFARMVSELNVTLDNAKRDASMTSALIGRIEAATSQLARAQTQSESYLKSVSEVLVKSHESFAENVGKTMRESNRHFQDELSKAVELLSGAIRNLGDVADEIALKKR